MNLLNKSQDIKKESEKYITQLHEAEEDQYKLESPVLSEDWINLYIDNKIDIL